MRLVFTHLLQIVYLCRLSIFLLLCLFCFTAFFALFRKFFLTSSIYIYIFFFNYFTLNCKFLVNLSIFWYKGWLRDFIFFQLFQTHWLKNPNFLFWFEMSLLSNTKLFIYRFLEFWLFSFDLLIWCELILTPLPKCF